MSYLTTPAKRIIKEIFELSENSPDPAIHARLLHLGLKHSSREDGDHYMSHQGVNALYHHQDGKWKAGFVHPITGERKLTTDMTPADMRREIGLRD